MQKLTVSTLLRYLKNKLDTDNNLQRIYVAGEISDYHRHFSGHLYFTLKDENAAIRCVMFKSSAASLSFEPKTGDKVVVYANTSIFEANGGLQLYVLKISLDGLGDLYAKYEALKKKLEDEGKFNQDHKKELSKTYIDNVAVLVGDKSAAMSDIKTTFNRRWPYCKVDYYSVLVQGNDAPQDIIKSLKEVDKKGYDAIILARGGGSFEDLFCFNDEALVNTIYELNTFIITGIGHEQDYTLADFVADLRAPTPTASVELITPNISEIIELIDEYLNDLNDAISYKLNNIQMKYDHITDRLFHFQTKLKNLSDNIDNKVSSIRQLILSKITYNRQFVIHGISDIKLKLIYRLNNEKTQYKRLNTLLEAYSTQNVLKRGYSIVLQDNKVIKRATDLSDDEFDLKFYDGTIKAIKR